MLWFHATVLNRLSICIKLLCSIWFEIDTVLNNVLHPKIIRLKLQRLPTVPLSRVLTKFHLVLQTERSMRKEQGGYDRGLFSGEKLLILEGTLEKFIIIFVFDLNIDFTHVREISNFLPVSYVGVR